ncbi:MAG TPA: tRNA guanosine(34) transglycosylase Tgt [Balneolales bacterium]|nr:tRNA guanosine(34) transglycosylase Tgt [Balneolales bacterium]
MFTLLKTSKKSKARVGYITTDHGTIQTPIFMPVGTLGTVKSVPQPVLKNSVGARIILGNTYHLYLRPGNDIISKAGGLHRFINWDLPILTDSGGFQVFSLSQIRDLHEQGVTFQSHIDGSRHLFTPENVVETQRILGSDIMMVLDECAPNPSTYEYAKKAMDLTHRWARRGRNAFNESSSHYEYRQQQFGIVQGNTFPDLRSASSKAIAEIGFEGYAIGGLSVGEPAPVMYEMTDICTDYLPAKQPRYLMGVGTPANIIQSVALGVDMFDCVMPTRNGRNGMIFTRNGTINLRNAKWKDCFESADDGFPSELCQGHTLAYIHHLIRTKELLGLYLASAHNLTFYLWLSSEIRKHIEDDTFDDWHKGMIGRVDKRL